MKNGEFVTLFNGLTAVQSLKGVKFGLLVSKNIRTIQEELKDIEEASKPTDKFLELSQKMQVFMNQKNDEAIAKLEEEKRLKLSCTIYQKTVYQQILLENKLLTLIKLLNNGNINSKININK